MRKAATSSWLARGLMLLGLVLLLAAPLTPATAKPMDCCMDDAAAPEAVTKAVESCWALGAACCNGGPCC